MPLSKKFFLFLALVVVGCSKSAPPALKPQKPTVLVSIAPYQFMAERIAGPDFQVQTVVPRGANPHAYEPTSSQVFSIGQGQIWFCIGEPFEKKMIPILRAKNPNLSVADLREGIDLIEDAHTLGCKGCGMDHQDRHIWLSPKRVQKQAELIEATLSQKYPDKKELFRENRLKFARELNDLEGEIRDILKDVSHRTLLVSHPAFGYFCKDFGLVQLSVEYEGKDPRPKHLEEILEKAVLESAELALALPQYNNKGAQIIAEKIHKPIRFIDPYSADYFETMRKLAYLIADPYAN